MEIAQDIIEAIHSQSLDKTSADELIQLCHQVYELNINVGHDQLVRCMLTISNFDTNKFAEIIDSNFYGDPRDVIMAAQREENVIHYGINKLHKL